MAEPEEEPRNFQMPKKLYINNENMIPVIQNIASSCFLR